MGRILIVLMWWCLGSLPVVAAEYFVAPGGRDDANGGGVERAFGTIQKGVSVLKAGDVLTILPGEYHESVEAMRLAGAKEAPITIRAQRAGTVLLRGDVEVAGWEAVEGLGGVYSASFDKPVQGVADPRGMTHYASVAALGEIENMAGAFFHDAKVARLLVRTPDGRAPGVLSVSVENGCGLGLESCAHLVIEGLAFTGYQHADNSTKFGSRTRWGFVASKCESITVRRCVAYLSSGGFCLTANTHRSVIEDCVAFGNSSRTVGISNQILGWAVKDCVFRRNRIEGFSNASGSQDQITFYSNAGEVNVMENNVAVRGGYMDKGDAEKVRVTNNLSTGPRPQYYKKPDASNLSVAYNDPQRVSGQFADPVNGDFRLLPQSPQRGRGLNGADPGPHPFREEVYFVSPQGNDEAKGLSPERPWKTLKHAAGRAKAGDTIYLLPGVYEEALVPMQSGTAKRPIRFARRGDGRVTLDGKGTLPVGIDLSGRSHIAVEGLVVRNFTTHGARAEGGEGLKLSHVLVGGIGREGVVAKGVRGLELQHCLLARIGGAGVRLEQCAEATLTGNVFGDCSGARVVCDAATRTALWSDRNFFILAVGASPLVEVAGVSHATLADWQKAAALDTHSIAGAPGFDERATGGGGVLLRADSPLIGRGPLAAPMGPFRRLAAELSVPIEQVRLHSATATTANLECRTPSASVEVTLEWGEGAQLGNARTALEGLAHSISLTGLKPGTQYQARFTTSARETRTLFGTDRETLASTAGADLGGEASDITFNTPAASTPPRTYHVATDGDDRREGLSPDAAWRTLSHAATRAVAGDTVLVHGGTYDELVTVRGTGDAGAPVTFRTAPGAVVWLTGSDRLRSTAFLVKEKSHVVLDGFRFRDFLSVESNLERVVSIVGGSHHVVRRCFYDGRVPSGYMNVFLGVTGSEDCTIENCVIMLGMGEGMALKESPRAVVRHCVFYNNNIRALTINGDKPGAPVTLTHNLICAVIPAKGGSGFFRVRQLQNFIGDHNGYFDRIPESERGIVEVAFIGDKEVGEPKPGSYSGRKMTLAELRSETGNEENSIFGNPGLAVVKELSPRRDKDDPANNDRNWNARWLGSELHQTRSEIQPLDFHHFIVAPDSAFARSAAGKPIGLDPAAFGADFARAQDRGEAEK